MKGYDDESGECARVHEKVFQAGIHLLESSGIADIKGGYGVVLYVKQEDCEKALAALKM